MIEPIGMGCGCAGSAAVLLAMCLLRCDPAFAGPANCLPPNAALSCCRLPQWRIPIPHLPRLPHLPPRPPPRPQDPASLLRLQGRGVRAVVESLLSDIGMETLRQQPMVVGCLHHPNFDSLHAVRACFVPLANLLPALSLPPPLRLLQHTDQSHCQSRSLSLLTPLFLPLSPGATGRRAGRGGQRAGGAGGERHGVFRRGAGDRVDLPARAGRRRRSAAQRGGARAQSGGALPHRALPAPRWVLRAGGCKVGQGAAVWREGCCPGVPCHPRSCSLPAAAAGPGWAAQEEGH